MKAVVKLHRGAGHVELTEVPEPVCPADGALIEVAFTGVCGTDLHVYHDRFRNYPPVILGHEFSGTVVEAGDGAAGIHRGDRVSVLPSSAVVCGQCDFCRRGYYMFCAVRRGMGHGVNGSMARYAVARRDMVYRLPDSVSLREAALAEPFACAVQAIDELTDVHVGDTVLLSGPGPIGLACLILLAARGARVIAAGTEQDRSRLDLALRLGAVCAVDVTREDLQEVVAEETAGAGVDVAVDASGSESAVAASIQALKKMGALIQVGIIGRAVSLPFDQVVYKQLRLFGSLGHSLSSWQRVMRILEQRRIDLTPLISHVLPLESWAEAFELCESKRGVKVLLTATPQE